MPFSPAITAATSLPSVSASVKVGGTQTKPGVQIGIDLASASK